MEPLFSTRPLCLRRGERERERKEEIDIHQELTCARSSFQLLVIYRVLWSLLPLFKLLARAAACSLCVCLCAQGPSKSVSSSRELKLGLSCASPYQTALNASDPLESCSAIATTTTTNRPQSASGGRHPFISGRGPSGPPVRPIDSPRS